MIPVFNQEDERKAIVQFIGGVYINLVQNGSLSKLDYWKTWPVEDVLANDHIRPIDGAHWLRVKARFSSTSSTIWQNSILNHPSGECQVGALISRHDIGTAFQVL